MDASTPCEFMAFTVKSVFPVSVAAPCWIKFAVDSIFLATKWLLNMEYQINSSIKYQKTQLKYKIYSGSILLYIHII
jgi:hypothetical protein